MEVAFLVVFFLEVAIRFGLLSRIMSLNVGLVTCFPRFVGMLVWEGAQRSCIGPEGAKRYWR